jgi:hypothetical protein
MLLLYIRTESVYFDCDIDAFLDLDEPDDSGHHETAVFLGEAAVFVGDQKHGKTLLQEEAKAFRCELREEDLLQLGSGGD